MPRRAALSEEEEGVEREERSRLRLMEGKFQSLDTRRRQLIDEMRRLSAEQKELYDRRKAPQVEVEKLYEEHGALGKRLAEIRSARDKARNHLEAAVVGLRELRLTFPPADRLRPARLRKEIAELETRQQTRALSLDDENALIALLREKSRELKDAEARTAVVAEHERQRKEAESRVAACRAEVDRLGQEWSQARADRDAKMALIRSTLENAGGLVAQLREKGRARAAVMDQVDSLSREMAALDREAHGILQAQRTRRDEARRTLRAYSPRGRGPSEDMIATTADAQLEELLKRGKITLGGG